MGMQVSSSKGTRSAGLRGVAAAWPVAILLLACSSDSSGPGQPTPESVVVSGIVTEAGDGGAPITGATVNIGTFQATSAADGSYELRDVPTGSRQIQAVADGFEEYTETIELQAGENRHDVGMARLRLASVSGLVRAATTGDPVPDANVRAGDVEATSGPDGRYELQDLSPGPVELRATASGFNPYLDSLTIGEGANEHEIHLPPQTLFVQPGIALYLPNEVETVKGVFLYADSAASSSIPIVRFVATGLLEPGEPAPSSARREIWTETLAELALRHGLALMGLDLATFPDVFASLPGFADQTGHPELANAAVLAVGHSVGGCFVGDLVEEHPERVIGFQALKSGCVPPIGPDTLAGALQAVPAQFIVAENDPEVGSGTRSFIEEVFVVNRQAGALWALVVPPEDVHGLTPANQLLWVDWLDPVLEMRLPEESSASGSIELQPIDESAGWLGNRETRDIAEFGSYEDDPRAAVWLPSMGTAVNWQTFGESE